MVFARHTRFRDLVRYKNLHYLTDLRDQNVIILYPHFVGFEMCVFRLNQDVPLVSVYSNQKNELLDRKIYEGRQRYGNCKIISRREVCGRSSRPWAYTRRSCLPDQDFGARDSVFVPFFGADGHHHRHVAHCPADAGQGGAGDGGRRHTLAVPYKTASMVAPDDRP